MWIWPSSKVKWCWWNSGPPVAVPCVAEMPAVKTAYQKFHDRGFEVVGINLDDKESVLRRFIKEKELPWPQYFDGKGWGEQIRRAIRHFRHSDHVACESDRKFVQHRSARVTWNGKSPNYSGRNHLLPNKITSLEERKLTQTSGILMFGVYEVDGGCNPLESTYCMLDLHGSICEGLVS